jgi:DeoR family glycerol-3-phosphate regulon repressor
MSVNPRQQLLLDEIRNHGTLSVDSLARQLEVTPQTVRRDLRVLAERGLLARFHGGAGVPDSTTRNIAYTQRQSLNAEGKRQIAREVARQIPNGCSLILNLGTTVEEAARELRHHEGLRVVTNNPNVAAILAHEANVEVMLAGGTVRPVDHGIVGEATVEFVRQFKVDVGLIGISSIEPDGTLRDFDYREVRVAQAIMAASREVWLLADHTKFERRAMVELGHLSQIDVLITDAQPPEPFASLLRETAVRCEIATGEAS